MPEGLNRSLYPVSYSPADRMRHWFRRQADGAKPIVRLLQTPSSLLCLGPALPWAAAAEPVAHCGKKRRVAVEDGRERQGQRPEPGQTVKPDGRAVGCGHDGNGGAR